MQVGPGRAEQRRAEMAAREVEMVAQTQENRAEVGPGRGARFPRRWPSASGMARIGLLDYYEIKNLQADTSMRSSIAGVKSEGIPPRLEFAWPDRS